MDESYRLFNCARCHCQAKICRSCDHGNIYCPVCSEVAEQERLLRAGAKYQRTERGRLNHAARQQKYEALQEKMTHRGPPISPPELPPQARSAAKVLKQPAEREEVLDEKESEVSPTPEVVPAPAVAGPSGAVCCDFCGQPCGEFARRAPLRRRGASTRSRRRPRPPGHRSPGP